MSSIYVWAGPLILWTRHTRNVFSHLGLGIWYDFLIKGLISFCFTHIHRAKMISLPNDNILQEYFSIQLNLIKIVDNGFPETSIQSKINDSFKLCTLDDEGIFFFNSVSLSDKEKYPIFHKDSGFPYCTATGVGRGYCLRPHYWAFNWWAGSKRGMVLSAHARSLYFSHKIYVNKTSFFQAKAMLHRP